LAGKIEKAKYVKDPEKERRVTVIDVAWTALGMETAKLSTSDQRRITAIMERLDWERAGKGTNGTRWWKPAK
jgi:hypothetical protein